MYISTYENLLVFCEHVRTSKVLGVDTEFLREKTYYPRLCLIQVSTRDHTAAIDPLLIDDLTPLRKLLSDTSITKVFHACDQDLEVIAHALGIMPAPVFDTQLAAAFLGYRMQIGYGALVQAAEGVHLDKADALTDWSKRPLDASQLRYAEEDVLYLPSLYDRMMSELVARERLSWLEPELEAHVKQVQAHRDPREAYLHLKRSAALTRRQLAVAREVCDWRERLAAQRDLPRKWVVSDEVVVEICRRSPRTVEKLRRIRGTESLPIADAERVVWAVRRGLDCAPADYPRIKHRSRTAPEADGVADLMYALLRLSAEECGVAAQLIATREDLLDLMRGNDAAVMHGWRREVAGERLGRLLGGELGLTVKDGRVEVL